MSWLVLFDTVASQLGVKILTWRDRSMHIAGNALTTSCSPDYVIIANLELLAAQHPDKRPIIAQVLVALVRQMVPLPTDPDTTSRDTNSWQALAKRSSTAE